MLALIASCCLALNGACAIPQGPATPAPPPRELNPSLYKGAHIGLSKVIHGNAVAHRDARKVDILWHWETSGPEPHRTTTQTESVGYWPTAIVEVGANTLAVAGKARAVTVIELWEFSEITPPLPVLQQGTDDWVYAGLDVPVTRTMVYAEATAGLSPAWRTTAGFVSSARTRDTGPFS